MLQGHLAQLFAQYLNAEETRCLSLRFGLADGQARTIKATGEEMGITYTYTKKLLFSAMSKLRKPHVTIALKDYMEDDSLL